MTLEQQRIALAKCEGWKSTREMCPCPSETGCCGYHMTEMPDYLDDLNAVARLEARLNDTEWEDYTTHLYQLQDESNLTISRFFLTLTATQRCEALLKTLKLGTD